MSHVPEIRTNALKRNIDVQAARGVVCTSWQLCDNRRTGGGIFWLRGDCTTTDMTDMLRRRCQEGCQPLQDPLRSVPHPEGG
jgi:hypothetical protein